MMTRKQLFRTASAAVITALGVSETSAQDQLFLYRTDGMALGTPIALVDSLVFSPDRQQLILYRPDLTYTLAVNEIDSLTRESGQEEILVTYAADGVRVKNPYAFDGVQLTVGSGNAVTAESTLDVALAYRLSGSGTGAFNLYSIKKQTLVLDGLQLISPDGPALNLQSKKKSTIRLADGTTNVLEDADTYTTVGTEDRKGTLFSEGQLVFEGDGALRLTGRYKHAICTDDYCEIDGGTLTVAGAAADGIHANDYIVMNGGYVTVTNVGGDGWEAEAGDVLINGGTLTMDVAADDTKGVKCSGTLQVNGGEVALNVSGAQSKGFKSGAHILIQGGTLRFTCSGNVVVTSGEPSYCTAIKSDSSFVQTDGDITITHSGTAGKGISCDGYVRLDGGRQQITVNGSGGTYTNSSNATDTYGATCLKCDGDLLMVAGTYTYLATGSGGKCISTDGNAVYGDDTRGPTLTASTSGSKVSGSSGTTVTGPGGRPGGWPGSPGGSSSSSSGNPKALKSTGALTVNNGTFMLSTTSDGGEGMESKTTLTINGGAITANTYDDALQAAQVIVINGGQIYAYASNNDAIDSNGTLTVNGGITLCSGASSPEEGFDCDQNTFAITGGVLVGLGGSSSTPTTSACTQRSVLYRATVAQGTLVTLQSAAGEHVLSFTMPRSYSGQCQMLLSAPGLTASTSYTLYQGGSVTGGSSFQGLTTGGTYTPGSASKTFTTSSMVTSVQ